MVKTVQSVKDVEDFFLLHIREKEAGCTSWWNQTRLVASGSEIEIRELALWEIILKAISFGYFCPDLKDRVIQVAQSKDPAIDHAIKEIFKKNVAPKANPSNPSLPVEDDEYKRGLRSKISNVAKKGIQDGTIGHFLLEMHIANKGIGMNDAVLPEGRTPFMYAVKNTVENKTGWQVHHVKKFHDAATDVNARDANQRTALFYLVEKPDDSAIMLVDYLLDLGADPTLTDKDGKTALDLLDDPDNLEYQKTEAGREIKEKIVEAIANLRMKQLQDGTIDHKVLDDLIKANKIGINDPKLPGGLTPFMYAVKNGWTMDKVTLFWDVATDVNKRDENQRTVLFYVVERGCDVALVEYLFALGADPTLADKDGKTVLALLDDPKTEEARQIKQKIEEEIAACAPK